MKLKFLCLSLVFINKIAFSMQGPLTETKPIEPAISKTQKEKAEDVTQKLIAITDSYEPLYPDELEEAKKLIAAAAENYLKQLKEAK